MKKRNYKTLLAALMVLLLIPVCRWIVLPQLEKIPDDFSYQANIFSIDNFYNEREHRFGGEVLSITKFSYNAVKKENDGTLIIKNIFDVRKPSGENIFSVERLYRINPNTGAHITGKGEQTRDGFLFAPKNIRAKEDFTYWHINYNTPARMKFQGEEIIAGLKVYRYACSYHADQTENLTFLPGVPKERGVELDIFLQTWIDPVTGTFIKYEDHTTAWYYNIHIHQRLNPWNKFHNEFTQSSILQQVEKAKSKKQVITLIKIYFPSVFALIALFIVAFSWLLGKYKKEFMPAFIAVLIFLAGTASSLLFYNSQRNLQEEKQLEKFEADAGKALSYIKNELDQSKLMLDVLRFDYEASGGMERNKFAKLSHTILKKSGSVQAFGYVPVVKSDERVAYEEHAQQEGYPDFQFTEKNSSGELVKAVVHDFYLPVYFIEPYEGNQKALGYNLASDSARLSALNQAKQIGDMVVTPPLLLVQDKGQQKIGIIIYNPLFKNDEAKQKKISGYFSGVYLIDNLVNSALSSHDMNKEMKLKIADATTYNMQQIFSSADSISTNSLTVTKQLPVLNRVWEFNFYLAPIAPDGYAIALLILFIALVLTVAIATFRILGDKTKELKESNERFLKIFDNNPVGMVIVNLETSKFEYANKIFLATYGYSKEEVIGKTSVELHMTSAEHSTPIIAKLKQQGYLKDEEVQVHKKSGETFWSLNSAEIISIHDKKLILSSYYDISARKKAEQEQKRLSQYARSLIEASLDPLVTISADGKITDVNEASVKVTGVLREKLIGTDFSIYFTEPEKAREGYKQVFEKGFVSDYPLTIKHKNGELTDVLYNASVYKDDKGNVLGVFAAARDITVQKQLAEREVAEREKELQQIEELERFRKLTVGRELKMIDLKKEIEELKNKI